MLIVATPDTFSVVTERGSGTVAVGGQEAPLMVEIPDRVVIKAFVADTVVAFTRVALAAEMFETE